MRTLWLRFLFWRDRSNLDLARQIAECTGKPVHGARQGQSFRVEPGGPGAHKVWIGRR
jgi:hypothetical protein